MMEKLKIMLHCIDLKVIGYCNAIFGQLTKQNMTAAMFCLYTKTFSKNADVIYSI